MGVGAGGAGGRTHRGPRSDGNPLVSPSKQTCHQTDGISGTKQFVKRDTQKHGKYQEQHNISSENLRIMSK